MTPSSTDTPEKPDPLTPENMKNLRGQAINLTMQMWAAHGMHPVHVRYSLEPTVPSGLEATICSAAEKVKQTGGDPYSMVIHGLREHPEDTHVFCIPHRTPDGEMLVIAEGGGLFSPQRYRVAIHPTIHDPLAAENQRFKISPQPLDIESGTLSSQAVN